MRQVDIIPDKLPGQRRSMDKDRDESEQACAEPIPGEKIIQGLDERSARLVAA